MCRATYETSTYDLIRTSLSSLVTSGSCKVCLPYRLRYRVSEGISVLLEVDESLVDRVIKEFHTMDVVVVFVAGLRGSVFDPNPGLLDKIV